MDKSDVRKIAKVILNNGAGCYVCEKYDEMEDSCKCDYPKEEVCHKHIAEFLMEEAKKQKDEFMVGDKVMADGYGEIVYISEHHRNNDENDTLVKQYFVKYESGLLDIRTKKSMTRREDTI